MNNAEPECPEKGQCYSCLRLRSRHESGFRLDNVGRDLRISHAHSADLVCLAATRRRKE